MKFHRLILLSASISLCACIAQGPTGPGNIDHAVPVANASIAPQPKGPRTPFEELDLPGQPSNDKTTSADLQDFESNRPILLPSLGQNASNPNILDPAGGGLSTVGGENIGITGPLPLPMATSDISVVESTTFNGQILDAQGQPIEGAVIKTRSLNSSVPYEAETATAAGLYSFNNAPAGVQIEIIATLPDGTMLRRVEVLKSNKQGDPNANKYNFAPNEPVQDITGASPLPDPTALPTPLPTPVPTPTPTPTPEIRPLIEPTPYPTPEPTPTPTPLPTPAPAENSDYFYFSYDDSASTAAVELTKAALNQGRYPDYSWLRPWEFLNYEKFVREGQTSQGLFQVSLGLWKHADTQFEGYEQYEFGAHVSSPELDKQARKNLVLTVVLDVSGSMGSPASSQSEQSRLALSRFALGQLHQSLKAGDVVNLITFSDTAQVLLHNYQVGEELSSRYFNALDQLQLQGGTYLEAGMKMAYAAAQQYYNPNKINRVMMLTDAYANIGETDAHRVAYFTRINNSEGIYFSGLGIGEDFNEAFLNQLTEAGKGAYFSLLNEHDASRAMNERFMSLINVAARDVRFRLDYPAALKRFMSASEESSKVASNVQPTNFSYNTSQYFLEQFIAPDDATLLDEKIRLSIFYRDPESGENKVELIEKSLREISQRERGNIQDAHLVTLLSQLLSGQVNAQRARADLEFLKERNSPLAQEYKALLDKALQLQSSRL